jgi:hypothetical protein
MARRECFGSIGGGLQAMRAVQLHFQLTEVLVELVLFGTGMLAHSFMTIAETSDKPANACFLPPPAC